MGSFAFCSVFVGYSSVFAYLVLGWVGLDGFLYVGLNGYVYGGGYD